MKYKKEIFEIIKQKTNKPFDLDTNIRDLGLDSIDMVEMITDFEEKFGVTIPSNKVNSVKTVRNILEVLESI